MGMIKGMTGFGQAKLTNAKLNVLIEIKSVNHRYLDVNYFLPAGFGSMENRMRQILQQNLHRGRVTVTMKVAKKEVVTVDLNQNVVKMHMRNINRLKREFNIQGELSLSDIINLAGVIEAKEVDINLLQQRLAMEKCFRTALNGLIKMRQSEGRSLAADVYGQLKRMSLQINKIQYKIESILTEKNKKLTAEEFRSYQKSSDVNEEISRLQHFIDEIKPLLKSNVPVGKRIDFIAQEMQRETNTIGSKLQDKVVANAVIALKSKIEKIREQAQNIE
jgi:uncharacterized protein (TIGR00255 family)